MKSFNEHNHERFSEELKQKNLKSKKTKRHQHRQELRTAEDYEDLELETFEKM